MQIIPNCGKFLKRWRYQTTLPVSWETWMLVKKQYRTGTEQATAYKLGKEFNRAVYCYCLFNLYNQSVSSVNHVELFVTPWTVVRQASLSITSSWSIFKLMSIVLVMPSNHLILCHPLLLLPSIFPSIRVFSNELVLRIRWP